MCLSIMPVSNTKTHAGLLLFHHLWSQFQTSFDETLVSCFIYGQFLANNLTCGALLANNYILLSFWRTNNIAANLWESVHRKLASSGE